MIWARNATGVVKLQDAGSTKLVLYSSRTPQGARTRSPVGQRPQGQAAEGRLAGDHLGARDDRRRGHLRTVPGLPGPSANTGETYINNDLNAWLRAGYAVLRTDYEGLGTPASTRT